MANDGTRIAKCFARLRAEAKKGLIAYITAGDPSAEETVELVLALERGGADVIELGVPFSDPVADGPVIQASYTRALSKGQRTEDVFKMVESVRRVSRTCDRYSSTGSSAAVCEGR